MHARLQLDPHDKVSIRAGKDGAVEIVVLNSTSCECSAVVELSPRQLAAICEAASEQ